VKANGGSTLTIRKSSTAGSMLAPPFTMLAGAMLALGLLYAGAMNRRFSIMAVGVLILAITALDSCSSQPSNATDSRISVITVRAASGTGANAIVHDVQLCVTFPSTD
jgi:hypothetical protein